VSEVTNKAEMPLSGVLMLGPVKKVTVTEVEDQTDYAALLRWADAGMRDEEIAYPKDAPPTTKEQWEGAEEAVFQFKIK
jgi:hypothetical protein